MGSGALNVMRRRIVMDVRLGAADCGQHREAAGAAAEASMIVAGWPACARLFLSKLSLTALCALNPCRSVTMHLGRLSYAPPRMTHDWIPWIIAAVIVVAAAAGIFWLINSPL